MLLAVDLGHRAGFALYGRDGKLRWYRSQNFGTPARLKRAAERTLRELEGLEVLVLEGDRNLGEAWKRAAERRGLEVLIVSAERWRESLLPPRDRRSGSVAKAAADALAREVIARAPAKQPTSLRHDAAEAVLIGLWAVRTLGWDTNEG